MAINIVSTYSNPQMSIMQKFQNVYKNEVEQKAVVQKIPQKDVPKVRDMSAKDIREYLTSDEKRVLKEVFGDLNVDKNTPSKYSYTRVSDFLKGSQIDIRL